LENPAITRPLPRNRRNCAFPGSAQRRLWSPDWKPSDSGYYTILSRATDSAGRVQPMVSPWNPSGYLWNAIDRVGVTVEKTA